MFTKSKHIKSVQLQESDILHTAIESLERLTHADLKVSYPAIGGEGEALLSIPANGHQSVFHVVVREEIHRANLPALLPQLTPGSLLVAQYISGPSKIILREQALNYLESKGDCYIRDDRGLFWFFQGQQAVLSKRSPKHRLFHKNGVKLVFALLLEPELVNASYRQMAERANVSASTVGDILQDLLEAGFLLQLDEENRILHQQAQLLEKWTRYYLELVKPKQFRGNYRFARMEDRRDWRSILLPSNTFWGGEPAADLYTNFLTPAAWTLYSDLPRQELIRQLRLIPDDDGEAAVYAPFWSRKLEAAAVGDKIHPILTYADLIDSGDPRNLEIAKKLYEQEIKHIL